MKRYIKFSKITALGNDFIIIGDINGNYPNLFNPKTIKKLCSYHFGIGSDGLILVEPDKKFAFKMLYFNSDGSEASMCGNGARSVSFFAANNNIAGNRGVFAASDGAHSYWVNGNNVRVTLNVDLRNVLLDRQLEGYNVSLIDTGVPHTVVQVEGLKDFPVYEVGKRIRNNKDYFMNGSNVDFIQIIDEHNIKIRTFERGVEGETYSCGTGATATAILSYLKSFTKSPVNVINKLGNALKIEFTSRGASLRNVTLEGEVREIGKGVFDIYEY